MALAAVGQTGIEPVGSTVLAPGPLTVTVDAPVLIYDGCVRVPNDVIEQLATSLSLGTPVTIA